MKTTLALLLVLVFAAAVAVPLSTAADGAATVTTVRFPRLMLPNGARIVGASLSVRGAFVVGVAQIPLGWSLTLSMDPSCCPDLRAGFHHGAEALAAGEPLGLTVTLQPPPGMPEAVRVQGDVDYTIDFAEVKHVHLSMQELILSPGHPRPGA